MLPMARRTMTYSMSGRTSPAVPVRESSHMYMHTCVHECTCMHACMSACVCVRVRTRTCACTCACMHVPECDACARTAEGVAVACESDRAHQKDVVQIAAHLLACACRHAHMCDQVDTGRTVKLELILASSRTTSTLRRMNLSSLCSMCCVPRALKSTVSVSRILQPSYLCVP